LTTAKSVTFQFLMGIAPFLNRKCSLNIDEFKIMYSIYSI